MKARNCGFPLSAMVLAAVLIAPRASAAENTVVPLHIHNNFPTFAAKIDGRVLRLVFDLGGDFYLTLSESALRDLKTTPLKRTYEFSDAKGNILQSPMFKVGRIELGNATFTDIIGHVDTSHATYKAQTEGRDGMIGAPFLREHKVVLDYPNREMTLIPGESDEQRKCTGTEVPFLPEWQGSPVTKVSTDLGELTMVWDTGAPLSLIRKGRAQEARANTATAVFNSARFELAGKDFGPLQLRIFAYVEPMGTDGFVGYTFFEKNVVCIDFPRNRLFISRSEHRSR